MIQGLVLLALLAVLLLPGLAVRRQSPVERSQLLVVLLVALLVRLVAALLLHATGAYQLTGRGAITPDEATVDLAARLLANGDPRSLLVLGGSLHTSWLLVSWSVYDLLWNSLLAIKLLNVLLGTVLVVPVFLLARQLHSPRAARLAAWLVALFPAAVVWSGLALRESLIALLLSTLVLVSVTALPAAWRWRAMFGGVAVVALVALAFTRSYMVPLMIAVLVTTATLRRRGRDMVTAGLVVVAALGVVLALPNGEQTAHVTVALVAEPVGNVYNPLSDCSEKALCAAESDPRAAGSQAGTLPGSTLKPAPVSAGEDDLESSLQSVGQKGVVRAFAIATLAGRPVLRSEEFFQLLQPAVAVWWTLLPMMAVGASVLVRRRRWDGAFATAGYAGAVIVFLALTGQFIRHHYMIEPVGLVLAAIGLVTVRELAPESRLRRGALAASGVMAAAAAVSMLASLLQ